MLFCSNFVFILLLVLEMGPRASQYQAKLSATELCAHPVQQLLPVVGAFGLCEGQRNFGVRAGLFGPSSQENVILPLEIQIYNKWGKKCYGHCLFFFFFAVVLMCGG